MSFRRRRRIARALARVFGTRRAIERELVWIWRDVRDFRAELTTYLTLTPQPKRRRDVE